MGGGGREAAGANHEDGNDKGAATEIVHRDNRTTGALLLAIRQRSSRGLVDDAQHLQARDAASVLEEQNTTTMKPPASHSSDTAENMRGLGAGAGQKSLARAVKRTKEHTPTLVSCRWASLKYAGTVTTACFTGRFKKRSTQHGEPTRVTQTNKQKRRSKTGTRAQHITRCVTACGVCPEREGGGTWGLTHPPFPSS